jgi:hypothetical protein
MSLLELKQQHENNITANARIFIDMVRNYVHDIKKIQLIEKSINNISKWELQDIDTHKDYKKSINKLFITFADYYDHIDMIDDMIENIEIVYNSMNNISHTLKSELYSIIQKIHLAYSQFKEECKNNDIYLIRYISNKIFIDFSNYTNIPYEKFEAQIRLETSGQTNDETDDELDDEINDSEDLDIKNLSGNIEYRENIQNNDSDSDDKSDSDSKLDGANNKQGSNNSKQGSKENNDGKILTAIDIIRNVYYNYKKTTSLYAYVIQILVDVLFSYDKQIMFKILGFLEEDKNFALEGNSKNYFKDRQMVKDNPPLKKFGLLPVTDNIPLKQLLNIILAEEGILVPKVDLKKISKTNKIGFIVFNRIVYTPVEYNIRPLIIKHIAKDYIQPDDYGINKKTVDRFKTIRDFTKKEWNFSTEIIGEECEKFYIIETLDGENYRCLAPWMQSKAYSLPRFRVDHIMKYFKKDHVSNRASNYHAIMEKKMTQNMFLGRAIDIENLIDSIQDTSANTIRNDITDCIMKHIKDLIKKKYKSNIDNNVQMSEIIHDKDIPVIFYEKVLCMYKEGTQLDNLKQFNAGSFPFEEVLVSFMMELQIMTRRLSKELHDGYSRNPLKNEVFDKNNKEKMTTIETKLFDVVTDAIRLIIKDDSNIYLSMHVKYAILNDT